MANFEIESVLDVHHWNDTLFSFKTTRSPSFRFRNGEFVMIGLPGEDRPVMRAYSIASANYEEHLEFLSIKVPDGKLTSRLQHIKPGDEIFITRKPTGTLVADDLTPGKRLYLIASGTGLAPFMSIIFDPDIYEKFEQVVLFHGVRYVSELAYNDLIENQLPKNEYLGQEISEKLIYYPCVTREPYKNKGRITDLLKYGILEKNLGFDRISPEHDRFMLCGSPALLKDMQKLLDERGFQVSPRQGEQGDYVIDRAFVES